MASGWLWHQLPINKPRYSAIKSHYGEIHVLLPPHTVAWLCTGNFLVKGKFTGKCCRFHPYWSNLWKSWASCVSLTMVGCPLRWGISPSFRVPSLITQNWKQGWRRQQVRSSYWTHPRQTLQVILFCFWNESLSWACFLDLCLLPLAIESQICQGKEGPSDSWGFNSVSTSVVWN